MSIHPGAQPGPLAGVAAFDPQDAKLKLHYGDGGEGDGGGVHSGQPGDDIDVGLAVASFAQFRNDVGAEHEHNEKAAGRASSRARGNSSLISASPGRDKASTMLRCRPVMRWYSSILSSTC